MLAWVSPRHRASSPQSSAPVVACGSIFPPVCLVLVLLVLVLVLVVTGSCCLAARGVAYEAPYYAYLIRTLDSLSAPIMSHSRAHSEYTSLFKGASPTDCTGQTLSRARSLVRSLAPATAQPHTQSRSQYLSGISIRRSRERERRPQCRFSPRCPGAALP